MLEILRIVFDPAVIIVISTFSYILITFIRRSIEIKKDINEAISLLKLYSKENLIYRFKELDEGLLNIPLLANCWTEFKNTLIFTENIPLQGDNDDARLLFNPVIKDSTSIYCSVDPDYFFTEEVLLHRKLNYKFLSTVPTLLTGLGPLFTFLNIGIGFSKVDFSNENSTVKSVSTLMSSMKIAAVISVLAVGSALIFIILERALYNNFCKKPLESLQYEIKKLFDVISSEKFLIELIRESKIQNNSLSNVLESLPNQIEKAFNNSLALNLKPYLDSFIYGINKFQENQKQQSPKDVLDEFFES